MPAVAKLARKLESAGFPPKQAQDASAAPAETFSEWQSVSNLATREDVQKLEAKLEAKLSETKAEILKWMFGAIGLQTLAILGTVIGLLHNSGKV